MREYADELLEERGVFLEGRDLSATSFFAVNLEEREVAERSYSICIAAKRHGKPDEGRALEALEHGASRQKPVERSRDLIEVEAGRESFGVVFELPPASFNSLQIVLKAALRPAARFERKGVERAVTEAYIGDEASR
jgi:hypothetical protein